MLEVVLDLAWANRLVLSLSWPDPPASTVLNESSPIKDAQSRDLALGPKVTAKLFLSAYRFGKPVPVVMRSFAWEFPSALGASV